MQTLHRQECHGIFFTTPLCTTRTRRIEWAVLVLASRAHAQCVSPPPRRSANTLAGIQDSREVKVRRLFRNQGKILSLVSLSSDQSLSAMELDGKTHHAHVSDPQVVRRKAGHEQNRDTGHRSTVLTHVFNTGRDKKVDQTRS